MAARRGASTRGAILSAAHDVIAERGYHAATTAEICRRAGVSSGTFFHYFPRKPDVLVALLTAASGAEADPRGGLEPLLDEVIADAQRPGTAAFGREVAAVASLPEVAEALGVLEERRRAQVRAAVAQALDGGQADAAAAPEVLETRLRWVIEGFEALVAGGADPVALAPELRELARRALA